jgi:hypothetical protein
VLFVSQTPSTDLANPMRRQYRWMGHPSQPASPWQAPADVYDRDQTNRGRRPERAQGAYDVSCIESGPKRAGTSGAT